MPEESDEPEESPTSIAAPIAAPKLTKQSSILDFMRPKQALRREYSGSGAILAAPTPTARVAAVPANRVVAVPTNRGEAAPVGHTEAASTKRKTLGEDRQTSKKRKGTKRSEHPHTCYEAREEARKGFMILNECIFCNEEIDVNCKGCKESNDCWEHDGKVSHSWIGPMTDSEH